jgi:hypothetical protein
VFAAAGTYSVSAFFNGDSNFAKSTQTTITQTVGAATANVSLTPPSTAPSVNQAVTFSVAVNAATSGPTSPTGAVTFTDSVTGTQICTAPQLALVSGVPTASCAISFLTAGPHTITATYGGDSNFTAGTLQTTSVTVNSTATSTTLSGPTSTPAVNQSVTFTTAIAPAITGGAIPKGTVVFSTSNGSVNLCSPSVTVTSSGTSGTASCAYTFSSAGSYNITAAFTPSDSNFGSSTSQALSQNVNAATAALNLSVPAGQSQSTVNQAVTFTAAFSTISGTLPNGTITYTDTASQTQLCSQGPGTVTNGVIPTCTAAFSTVGAHTISAAFKPSDTNFNAATSNTITQTVTQTSTTTVVSPTSPSSGTSEVNQSVTFTATVTPATTGGAIPTGTVNFSATLGSQNLVLCAPPTSNLAPGTSTSTAICTAPLPSGGVWTVTANYSGDSNFTAGIPGSVTQTVGKTAVSLTGIPATDSSEVNSLYSLTATVASTIGGSTVPSGTISFIDGSNTLCGGPVSVAPGNASGTVTASCSETLTSAGTHTIVVTYNGDNNFTTNAATASVSVASSPTALVLSSSNNTIKATQAVTFTAVITPTQKGVTPPSGTVAFLSTDHTTDAVCGAVPVALRSDGAFVANCPVTFPHNSALPGQINVTATYNSDPNYKTSAGATVQTVQDFDVTFNVTPTTTSSGTNHSSSAGVYLTQGYANVTVKTTTPALLQDPFNPATITVTVNSSGSFSDTLNVSCVVTSNATNAAVSDPSCILASPATISGATGSSLTYVLSASSKAPVGTYAVTLTFADPQPTTLLQTSAPLTLNVIATSASVSLGTGGATATESAEFSTPTSITGTPTVSCPQIWDTLNNKMESNANNSLLTCSGPSGSITTIGSVTTIPITISTSGSSASLPSRSGSLYLAGVVGLPLLAVIGWLGGGRSRRKNLFRLFSLMLLAMGFSLATGCGGSFTRPTPLQLAGISAGSYLVQVVATDSSGNKYYAEVPLVVNAQ